MGAQEGVAGRDVAELALAARSQGDRGADRIRLAVFSFEDDRDPGAGGSLVAQQDGRPVEGADQQVEPAVVVEVADREPRLDRNG